jgi:hypothetical protein
VTADESTLRAGSNADLARRMDRMEQRQEKQEAETAVLSAAVARVEINQSHAAELAKLRFDGLDTGMKNMDERLGKQIGELTGHLDRFITRIEGVISGDVQTTQQRQGEALVKDYQEWRGGIGDWQDGVDEFRTQVKTSTRIFLLVAGSSWVGTAIAVWAFLSKAD